MYVVIYVFILALLVIQIMNHDSIYLEPLAAHKKALHQVKSIFI